MTLSTKDIAHAYQRFFASGDGQIIRQHLLDTVYNTVYEGCDPQEALVHNARRTVIHELFDNCRPLPQEDDHA